MAIETIPKLRTRANIVKNETIDGSNTANRIGTVFENIVDTLEYRTPESTPTPSGGGKWETFQVRFLKCRMYAPFNSNGSISGYKDKNQFGEASIKSGMALRVNHYNTSLFASYSGFPTDEDISKFGLAFYIENPKTFKGTTQNTYGNRFSRGSGGIFQPASRPSQVGTWSWSFRKLCALDMNGLGWFKNTPSNKGLKAKRLSELKSGTYGEIANIMQSFDIVARGQVVRLFINNKFYKQRSVRVHKWTTKRLKSGINIKFEIPFEIRLIQEIGEYGRKKDIKTMFKGYLVAGATVYADSDMAIGSPNKAVRVSKGYIDVK